MKHALKLGWLYPDLMSTYGDRGNILILKTRSELRDISLEILNIDENSKSSDISSLDMLFGGGAQDSEQRIVMQDLRREKIKYILDKIEDDMPALFVCGAPQLMGKSYEPAAGETIEGVGIFDMTTKHPSKNEKRLIGNIVAKIHLENIDPQNGHGSNENYVVGFENHGGRTQLGSNAKPFAKVLVGFGNNGEDKTEGVVYKNAIGTYLHGPLFSKNPHMADWFLRRALEVKYNTKIKLKALNDLLENTAQTSIARRLGIEI